MAVLGDAIGRLTVVQVLVAALAIDVVGQAGTELETNTHTRTHTISDKQNVLMVIFWVRCQEIYSKHTFYEL